MKEASEANDENGWPPEATRSVASPPPVNQSRWGPTPDGTAPHPHRGRRKTIEDLLRKQFLSVPRLRCLWSSPAGLLPRGLWQWNRNIDRNSGESVKRDDVVASITRPPDEQILAAQSQSDVPLGLGICSRASS